MILNTETSKRLKSKNIYAQIYEFLRKIRSSRYSYSCYSKRETGYPVLIPEEIEKLLIDNDEIDLLFEIVEFLIINEGSSNTYKEKIYFGIKYNRRELATEAYFKLLGISSYYSAFLDFIKYINEFKDKETLIRLYNLTLKTIKDKIFSNDMYYKLGVTLIDFELYSEAIKSLEKASDCAKKSQDNAALLLAELYSYGNFKKDKNKESIVKAGYKKALKYYKIYDKNYIEYYQGLLYYYGLGGLEVNYKKAMSFFEKTSKGTVMLGDFYYYGIEGNQNYLTALEKYTYYPYNMTKEQKDKIVDCFNKMTDEERRRLVSSNNSTYKAYLKVMAERGDLLSLYQDAINTYNSSMQMLNYSKTTNKEYYEKEIVNCINKLLEFADKIMDKIDCKDSIYLVPYIKTYPIINEKGLTNSKHEFIYKYCMTLQGSKDFYLDIAKGYSDGLYITKDIEKAKYYFSMIINNLYTNMNKNNKESITNFILAYEILLPVDEKIKFKYKLAKSYLGDDSYNKEIGFAYLNGTYGTKDTKLAKPYLRKYLEDLKQMIKDGNTTWSKEYINLCDLLFTEEKKSIEYLLCKSTTGDVETLLKVINYYRGNNQEQYKKYCLEYLKILEKDVNEENPKNLKEYINVYNEIYSKEERMKFKYILAYALLNDHYAQFVLGLKYESGDEVEVDIEKAKKYFKLSYEGGYDNAYGKYQQYFKVIEKPKVSEVLVVRYVQLLELNHDNDITVDDVEDSYRALSKIYHPDIANKRYSDGKKFMELKEARDYLIEYIDDVNVLAKKYFYNEE